MKWLIRKLYVPRYDRVLYIPEYKGIIFGKVLNTNQEVRYVGFDYIYILEYVTIK